MSHPILSASFREKAEQHIEWFEKQTSCEIRLHIEMQNNAELMDRAAFVFDHLGMKKTKLRNAILIYIQITPSKLALLGVSGLHFVSQETWETWTAQLSLSFKECSFESGIRQVLEMIVQEVKGNFPYQLDDINELSNQISQSK